MKNEHTHTHARMLACTHSHSLCQFMLLTTPTSLSFAEPEDKQQLLSHHLTLRFITLALPPITLSFHIFHISSTFQPYCHRSPPSTLSLQSMLYWSSWALSCHIFISLNSHTFPLYLAGLFPFSHRYTIFLSISTYSLLRHSLSPTVIY